MVSKRPLALSLPGKGRRLREQLLTTQTLADLCSSVVLSHQHARLPHSMLVTVGHCWSLLNESRLTSPPPHHHIISVTQKVAIPSTSANALQKHGHCPPKRFHSFPFAPCPTQPPRMQQPCQSHQLTAARMRRVATFMCRQLASLAVPASLVHGQQRHAGPVPCAVEVQQGVVPPAAVAMLDMLRYGVVELREVEVTMKLLQDKGGSAPEC